MRRKKGFRKFLVYALAGVMTLSNITPALAYTDSEASVEYQTGVVGSNETTVYAELGNEYKVTIPKSLTLDGKTKTGSYTVDVEGDIAGTDIIKVVPEEAFTLTSTGFAGVTASISQDKTSWTCSEILAGSKTIGNGTINASGINAGEWEGTFWFNINLEEGAGTGDSGTGEETQHTLTLSDYSVAMGEDEAVQVTAYLDGQAVNESVTWTSDNENITVENGLVETKASAEVGDTATVTVTAENPENLSAMANVLSDMGLATVAMAEEDLSIDFVVTIVDIEYSVDELNLKAGESVDVTAKIIPEEINGIVSWSQTAISGISLVKNGNTVTINVADDMEAGTYELVATYGDYSKTLIINIVENHEHSYGESITKEATCTEAGIKTYACICGDSYTEEIPATGHTASPAVKENEVVATCTTTGSYDNVVYCSVCNEKLSSEKISTDALGHSFKNGICTRCGEADPNYVLEAGLYDANGVMLCTWEESGIDVEKDYQAHTNPETTCPRYALTNTYKDATKVVLPENVTSIGDYTFYNCPNLTSIEIPNGVTSIGKYAFFKTNLTSIEIPDKITTIEESSFSCCASLTSITIPNGVTSIGRGAFTSCESLTSITIPDSVTSIENDAFSGCSNLTSIEIPEGASIGDNAFGYTKWLTERQAENPLVIVNNTLISADRTSESVVIPEGVTRICKGVFQYNRAVKSITLPNSLTSIGQNAFWQCTEITSITIPSKVISIEDNAFYGCTKLTSVTFKSTYGWYYQKASSEVSIKSSDLSNTSTAATCLKSSYRVYDWIKK